MHALATELARLRGTTATSAVLDALTVEMEKERANHAIDWQAFADVQRRCQGVDDPWLTDDDIYDSEGNLDDCRHFGIGCADQVGVESCRRYEGFG